MKLSFSTVGCPNFTWDEIISTAKDFGYDGIEIRGLQDELKVYNASPFLIENIQNTFSRLMRLNLSISCISTSCYIFDKDLYQKTIDEAKQYMILANRLKCKYIRVLADEWINPSGKVDEGFVFVMLKELCQLAADFDVDVLIETNGVFAESKKVYNLLKDFPFSNVGVVWDIHHPFRFFNEDVEYTYNNIKNFVKHVHVKDSKIEKGNIVFKMIGEGDVPFEKAIKLLIENNYDGFISLEWVKRWFSYLEEPGIVFSHFAEKIRKLLQ